MLPKKKRITKASFAETAQGFLVFGEQGSIRVKKLAVGAESRFGVVISNKVVKNKPERNLLKRRVYEIFKEGEGFVGAPCSIIFYARKETPLLSYQKLKEKIFELLKKIK